MVEVSRDNSDVRRVVVRKDVHLATYAVSHVSDERVARREIASANAIGEDLLLRRHHRPTLMWSINSPGRTPSAFAIRRIIVSFGTFSPRSTKPTWIAATP